MTKTYSLKYTNNYNNLGSSTEKTIFIKGDFAIRNYDERNKNQADYLPKGYIKIIGDKTVKIEEGDPTAAKTGDVADFSKKKAEALEYIANLDGNSTLSKNDILLIKGQKNFIIKELGLVNLAHDYINGVVTLKWGDKDILRIDFRPHNSTTTTTTTNSTTSKNNADNKKAQSNQKKTKINSDTKKYLDALAMRESSNDEDVINYAGYVGKYQMGEEAMASLGIYYDKNYKDNDWGGYFQKNKYNINSLWDYRYSPDKQDALIFDYKKLEWSYIKNLKLDKYVGKTINGIKITESGLLAGCHLVGIGGLKRYLTSNGTDIPMDGNKVSIEVYLRDFAGYDVSQITS